MQIFFVSYTEEMTSFGPEERVDMHLQPEVVSF